MANTHSYFIGFSKKISIRKTRQKQVQTSRKLIEKVITRFTLEHNLGLPRFKLQGSYYLNTVVIGETPDYDLDLGVYLKMPPPYSPAELKRKLDEVANRITDYGSENKAKCIQVLFRKEYSIDIALYIEGSKTSKVMLATKHGWEASDVTKFHQWAERKICKKKQPIRLIKYLKAWASNLQFKAPSGLVITVLVLKYYKSDRRDDLSLFKTLSWIIRCFSKDRKCIMPVAPFDNLLTKLSEQQVKFFFNELRSLQIQLKLALHVKSKHQAAIILQKAISDEFPINLPKA